MQAGTTVCPMTYAHSFIVMCLGLVVSYRYSRIHLPISFRAGSLVLGQSYDCPSASEATLSLYLLSGRASYCKISWSLKTARSDATMIVLLWNTTSGLVVLLPRFLSNFGAIAKSKPGCRGFETSWDLAVRRPSAWWTEALKDITSPPHHNKTQ